MLKSYSRRMSFLGEKLGIVAKEDEVHVRPLDVVPPKPKLAASASWRKGY